MRVVTWIVVRDGFEIGRYSSKKIAKAVAHELDGYVVRYVKESR